MPGINKFMQRRWRPALHVNNIYCYQIFLYFSRQAQQNMSSSGLPPAKPRRVDQPGIEINDFRYSTEINDFGYSTIDRSGHITTFLVDGPPPVSSAFLGCE